MTVELSDGENDPVTPTTQPGCRDDGIWWVEVDTGDLNEGAITITVTQGDRSYTAQAEKNTSSVAVSITRSNNILEESVESYSLGGSCNQNGERVEVTLGDGILELKPDGAAPALCASREWSVDLDVSSLRDDVITVTAVHYDSNSEEARDRKIVLKDTVAPTVLTITDPAHILAATVNQYQLQGTCGEVGGEVRVELRDDRVETNPSVRRVEPSPQLVCNSEGEWSVEVDAERLREGHDIYINIIHSDEAGNELVEQNIASVVKDTTYPDLGFTSPAAISEATKTNYQVEGTCSEEGREVSVVLRDSVGTEATPPERVLCQGTAWAAVIDTDSLVDGGITLEIEISDSAGNPASDSETIMRDTILPSLAINPGDNIASGFDLTQYPVSGTCDEEAAMVTVSATDSAATPNTTDPINAPCSSAVWSATLNGEDLQDGQRSP